MTTKLLCVYLFLVYCWKNVARYLYIHNEIVRKPNLKKIFSKKSHIGVLRALPHNYTIISADDWSQVCGGWTLFGKLYVPNHEFWHSDILTNLPKVLRNQIIQKRYRKMIQTCIRCLLKCFYNYLLLYLLRFIIKVCKIRLFKL